MFPVLCRVHVQDVACLMLCYGLHCHSLSVMSEMSANSVYISHSAERSMPWDDGFCWYGGGCSSTIWPGLFGIFCDALKRPQSLLWGNVISFDEWDDSFSSQTCVVMCLGDAGKSPIGSINYGSSYNHQRHRVFMSQQDLWSRKSVSCVCERAFLLLLLEDTIHVVSLHRGLNICWSRMFASN